MGCRCHAGFLTLDSPEAFDFHCVEACQQNILELRSRLLAAVSTIPSSQGPSLLPVALGALTSVLKVAGAAPQSCLLDCS